MQITLDSEYVDLAAEVFTLLSDPTRIRIILALEEGELAVGELAARVGKAPTAVSQHLAKLRWAKVVQTRQEGTRVYYSLIDEHARELVHQAVFQAEHVIDFWPRHHLAADQADPAALTGRGSVGR
jgi:DNA-binding transcriptional ArsR family regulator